MTKTAIRSLLL